MQELYNVFIFCYIGLFLDILSIKVIDANLKSFKTIS